MIAYNQEYTTEQYMILKKIYRNQSMTAAQCRNKFGQTMFKRSFAVLRENGLILDNHTDSGVFYTVTDKGANIYFVLHDERRRFWLPIAISVMALLVSIISLIVSICK